MNETHGNENEVNSFRKKNPFESASKNVFQIRIEGESQSAKIKKMDLPRNKKGAKNGWEQPFSIHPQRAFET
jgi:hypothetical protein